MVFDEFLKNLCGADIIYEGQDGIVKDWTTGGQTGGSCWGCSNEDYRARETESEPDMDELDQILTMFCPNISFLQYKALTKELVRVEHDIQDYNDYYGNDRIYSKKSLNLEELYNYICDKGWISGS